MQVYEKLRFRDNLREQLREENPTTHYNSSECRDIRGLCSNSVSAAELTRRAMIGDNYYLRQNGKNEGTES